MSGAAPARWWVPGSHRLLVAVLVAATAATLGLVVHNAVTLSAVTARVQATTAQSAGLGNVIREVFLLLNAVTNLGGTATPEQVGIRRGLLDRQIDVAVHDFPPGAPEAVELLAVQRALDGFPWDRLADGPADSEPYRLRAMDLVSTSERRVNALRDAQDKLFVSVTDAALEATRRSQIGLSALVAVVLAVGISGVAMVLSRNRGAQARANAVLQAEVTERRALEEELVRQARYDPLTGLPNRLLLLARMSERLGPAAAPAGRFWVVLVDLDGFKSVNDTLGHPAGDELLRDAARRLGGCVRAEDTPARLGGDEFAVLVPGDRADAVAVGGRIVEALRLPFTVAGIEVRIGASVGVAPGRGSASAADVLRDADIAMYEAKSAGKGRLEVFERGMRTRASARTGLQQQLARAVDLHEIEVHYQPVIDLRTFRPTALEALARWRRPDRSLVPADVFIPIAEESGAIMDIGRRVLRQACHDIQLWRGETGREDLTVAVNVSMRQVLSGRLTEHVFEALQSSGAAPSTLTLEITESTALTDPERVAVEFSRLQDIGVRIAVDDFGSGYSSLGFLLGLDADVLKIDRTLLEFDTMRHGSLVTAIADLGRTLGLQVVVEGVETVRHLERAQTARCDAAQGFHLSRPLPFDQVLAFLTGWEAEEAAVRPATLPGA